MEPYERIPSQFEEDFPLKKEDSIFWKLVGVLALTVIVTILIYGVIHP